MEVGELKKRPPPKTLRC